MNTLGNITNTIVFVLFFGLYCNAEQTIVYINPLSGQTLQVTGTIEDYTRQNLILRTSNQQLKTIPSETVVEIKTQRLALFDESQARVSAGQYEEAVQLLDKAFSKTLENWSKQEILANQIDILNKIGKLEPSILKYIQLIQLSPQTAFFDSVPLVWTSFDCSPQVEKIAQRCLLPEKSPFVSLMGASILLTTDKKSEALNTLKKLSQSDDSIIATLAQMQIHRLSLTPLPASEIKKLESLVNALPKSLQYGPRFVLAQLWSRCLDDKSQKNDRIVLQYLQCAQNPKTPLELQARSMYSAGNTLIETGYKDEGFRVFIKLIHKYPESSWAEQAKSIILEKQ